MNHVHFMTVKMKTSLSVNSGIVHVVSASIIYTKNQQMVT